MLAAGRVDELTADANATTGRAQAALLHVVQPELAGDLLRIDPLALVAEGGVAGDHGEPPRPRQLGDQVLRDAVEKELRLGVAAEILKRQYRDGRLFRRRGGSLAGCARPRCFPVQYNAEGADRARDVGNLMLAQIGKGDRQLIAHLVAHRAADVDAARFGKALQPRGNRDAVAIDGFAVAQHIADIDTHAEADLPLGRHIDSAFRHRALDRDRTMDRVDDATEFDQQTVTHRPHGPSAVFEDFRIDDLAPRSVEGGGRPLLIHPHQARIADHVGAQDDGKPAVDLCRHHGIRLCCSRASLAEPPLASSGPGTIIPRSGSGPAPPKLPARPGSARGPRRAPRPARPGAMPRPCASPALRTGRRYRCPKSPARGTAGPPRPAIIAAAPALHARCAARYRPGPSSTPSSHPAFAARRRAPSRAGPRSGGRR